MERCCCVSMIMMAAFTAAGCSQSSNEKLAGQNATNQDGKSVYVVNYPLQYFAERIGGKHVQVNFPAPPNEDPAFWMPPAETIAAYQQADLILLNGATYAKWVDKVSLPASKLCDTSTAFTNEFIEMEGTVTHSHGPDGEHAHGEIAFTTWLDPDLAMKQADAIRDAMTQQWPDHKSAFTTSLVELQEELQAMTNSIEQTLADVADTPIVFSHPVYQYFQRRFNLNGRCVHWEPDETPSAEQWSELGDLLKTHQAKWMIWEAAPKQETVDRLREMGIESVVFDPCGNTPETGDYLSVMKENLRSLMQAKQALTQH